MQKEFPELYSVTVMNIQGHTVPDFQQNIERHF
jgi:hypothetical protein